MPSNPSEKRGHDRRASRTGAVEEGSRRGERGARGDRNPVESSSPSQPVWSPLHWAAVGAVFLLLALFSFRQIGNYDTGFHLRTGAYILEGHAPPATDPFSYTMRDHRYTDTSWGYDVLVALIERASGAPGLVVFHTLLVLTTFALVLAAILTVPADPTTTVIVLGFAAVASEIRFECRPEVLSFALLAGVLLLLHRYAAGQKAPLWLLPVILLVWANLHGLFVLGWVAIACFAAGLWIRHGSPDRRLLAWGAASIGVALVNPYGIRGFLFPFELATRMSGANAFAGSIEEFVSPFNLNISANSPFYPWQAILCFRILIVLSAAGLVLLWRERGWTQILLWGVFTLLAYKMVRNLPIFVVACVPGIVHGLPFERIASFVGLARDRRALAVRIATGLIALAAIVAGLRVVHNGYYVENRRIDRFGWGWNRLALPIDAAAFLTRAGIEGPMLNHLNLGGYLMWARGEPVFIDGRLEVVGEKFFGEYRRAIASPAGLEGAVSQYGIRYVVFPYPWEPDLLRSISQDPRWTLAYRDHLAAIFVRTDAVRPGTVDPELARELVSAPGVVISGGPGGSNLATAEHQGGIGAGAGASSPGDGAGGAEVSLGSLPWMGGPPRPSPWSRWLSGMVAGQRYPIEVFNRGVFHLTRGELERAKWYFLRSIEESGGAFFEQYGDLGSVLLKQQQYETASLCYRTVLAERPNDRIARQVLAALAAARPAR